MILLTIALAIIMPIAACALNSWLNIKIKFATDVAHAKRDVRRVFFRIFNWAVNAYCVGIIVWQVVSPSPLTRLSLVSILIPFFGLVSSYLQFWMLRIQNQLSQSVDISRKLAEAAAAHGTLITHLIDKSPK
jgi:hypothetical protein